MEEQGWLSRVGRGSYVSASIDTLGSDRVLDDASILVPALFAPAYIGGRTAAEHWDLTEQIFNDIVVITGQAVRAKRQERHGFQVHAETPRPDEVLRHQTGLAASNQGPSFRCPSHDHRHARRSGSRRRHPACCGLPFSYLGRQDRDDQKLIDYGERLGNGTVFKRLGFLAEKHESGSKLAELCAQRLTAGISKLDPALNWRASSQDGGLLVPAVMESKGRH